jgi:hypothetical protein
MTISTPKSFIHVAKLCAATALVLASTASLAASESDKLQLAYQATFPNGSLEPSVNDLDIEGPMLTSSTLGADSNPTFTSLPGELFISVTRPVDTPAGVVASAVVSVTPVNFGPGSISRVSATFRAPFGPLVTGGWAVQVYSRTGGQDDLSTETRVAATLRVQPGGEVRLNVPQIDSGGAPSTTFMVLPVEILDDIFLSPKPFTLDLTIDRTAGTGNAKLTVGNHVFRHPFDLKVFPVNDEPTISAMGAGVAMNGSSGQTVSVHLREFRIYAPSSSNANAAETCSEAFVGFNCRAVPEPH